MAYNSDALYRGIDQAKANIKTFEEAIEKERETIKQYYAMIDENDKRERLEKEKQLHIEIDNGDD